MAKDSGYPAIPAGNEIVDFVWGPQPLQPNTDRIAGAGSTGCGTGASGSTGTGGSYDTYNYGGGDQDVNWAPTTQVVSDLLDPTLDSHVIATGLLSEGIQPGWSGYPNFLPNDIDAVPGYTPIPYVVGANVGFAQTQLLNAGFNNVVYYVGNSEGATALNNGQVKYQSPEGGITSEPNTNVSIYVYNYVSPLITQWNWADYHFYIYNTQYNGENLTVIKMSAMDGQLSTNWNALTSGLTPAPANNGWAGLQLEFDNLQGDSGGMPQDLSYFNNSNHGPWPIHSSSVEDFGYGFEITIRLVEDHFIYMSNWLTGGTVTVKP